MAAYGVAFAPHTTSTLSNKDSPARPSHPPNRPPPSCAAASPSLSCTMAIGSLATYILAAGHSALAFVTLSNPSGAAVSFGATEPVDAFVAHCTATIGTAHVFIAVLLLMAAQLSGKNIGHRMCIVGIYIITFLPCSFATQFIYPSSGTAPSLVAMPMLLLYAFTGLAVLVMATSPSEKKKAMKAEAAKQ